MARETFIYALCDPNTGMVRYVGKADDVNVRYKRHMYPQELNADNHKARWIRHLLSEGQTPSVIVLEKVDSTNWQNAERKWIAYFRTKGIPLTNSTSGGDGIDKGTKHRPEAVKKIIDALTGRPVSDETRQRLSRSHSGKQLSNEHRKKLSKVRKDHWKQMPSDERETKITRLNHGWSESSRRKLSQTRTGKKRGSTTSSYVGVAWFKRDACWRAYICISPKQIHLGYHDTEAEAARAYDAFVKEHNLDRPLNFSG